ncbi:hypothetical protein [Enterococcus sp. LJL51]|uniref:hypothetical protein n=1 Tax=Enterococcus sp. LJL51 TaxID=3416656 RepID=UPI003CF005F4
MTFTKHLQKAGYLLIRSLNALMRRKGYFFSFCLVGMLYFLLFFSIYWSNFFTFWIHWETELIEKSQDIYTAQAAQPLLMLLKSFRIGTIILSNAFFLAGLFYTKNLYRQIALIEKEAFYIERMLGEQTSVISLTFVAEAFYVMAAAGLAAMFLSRAALKKILGDISNLGGLKQVISDYQLGNMLTILVFLLLLVLTLAVIFRAVFKQVDSEQLNQPASEEQSREGDLENDK